jgi:hypothetical protein
LRRGSVTRIQPAGRRHSKLGLVKGAAPAKGFRQSGR